MAQGYCPCIRLKGVVGCSLGNSFGTRVVIWVVLEAYRASVHRLCVPAFRAGSFVRTVVVLDIACGGGAHECFEKKLR